MELQSVCGGKVPISILRLTSPSHSAYQIGSSIHLGTRRGGVGSLSYCTFLASSKGVFKRLGLLSPKRDSAIRASSNSKSSDAVDKNVKLSKEKISLPRITGSLFDFEASGGNSGSVSFCGLNHENVEEWKRVLKAESAPSFLWTVGPVVLISSLIIPQFFIGQAINQLLKDVVVAEIVSSLCFEAVFYIGLSVFLGITNWIQRPYMERSSKWWGRLNGPALYSAIGYGAMSFKFLLPFLWALATWPMIGVAAVVAVIPYIAGCIAQTVFEVQLSMPSSPCLPLVPIIFEVYRLYQLTKGAYFVEKLLFTMRGLPESPQLMRKGNGLVSLVVMFQILAVASLWSLITYLMTLIPSRPAAGRN